MNFWGETAEISEKLVVPKYGFSDVSRKWMDFLGMTRMTMASQSHNYHGLYYKWNYIHTSACIYIYTVSLSL